MSTKSAAAHYNNFAPALLTEDAKFLDQFEKVADDFIYEERDPKKVREEMLEALDRANLFLVAMDIYSTTLKHLKQLFCIFARYKHPLGREKFIDVFS